MSQNLRNKMKKEENMTDKNKSYIKLAGLFVLALSYVIYQQFLADMFFKNKPDDFVEVVLSSPQGQKINVLSELAANDADRAQGLMYLRDLTPDAGMLFLWKKSDIRSFWMKNTYIPLDMIFMDGTNIVGFVENAKPHTVTPRTIDKKANAVLEVQGGFVKMHGLDTTWKVSYSISNVEVQ
jgi:uncharacterized membrane protein (UPF0127 family)